MSTVVYAKPPNRSDSIAALAAALSKAQGSMTGATKHADNPFFKSKYADLASVWDACREPLSTNGLAVVQTVDDANDNGRIAVETVLMHASGEWISGRIAMKPVKDDPQAFGSAITYARRYGLQAIVGIAPEDDDGNAASGKLNPKVETDKKSRQSTTVGAAVPPPLPQADGNLNYISEPQQKRFWAIVKAAQWAEDDVKTMLKDFGVISSKHIPKANYERICGIIEHGTFADYLDFKTNSPNQASA